MITCRNCRNAYIKIDVKALGVNIHTKIEEDNVVKVIPEYYNITEIGTEGQLSCECGNLEIMFFCDYCGNPTGDTTNFIQRAEEGKQMVCSSCLERWELEDEQGIQNVSVEDIKFIVSQ